MADYRGKANKLEKKKSFFCVTASKGLNGPYFTHFPLLKFFFIKEMTSLMNHVRFGTVIAYICGNWTIIRKFASFWSKSLTTSTFRVHMMTHKPPTSFKSPEIYFYMSILLNCIHITKNYKTSHGVL